MKLTKIKVGYLRTNCYVLEENGCVIVIDPGDNYESIMAAVGDNKIIGVFISHVHPDHVGALEYFDQSLVYDYSNLTEGKMELGPFTFEVIFTPGHKEDSVSLYFAEEKKLFTGDFIFKDALGRTDFPGGSDQDMKNSIIKISKYPIDTEVYPGHGSTTTLELEMANNRNMIEI